MKTQILFLSAIISVMLISCKQNDTATPANTTPPANPGTPEIVTDILSDGIWKVDYYLEDNRDETNSYRKYIFNFSNNGTCNADDGTSNYTGIWHSGYDDSKVKLKLMFPLPSTLLSISEDWQVIETTKTKIRLMHTSGGTGNTDLLTMKKL